MHPYLDRGAPIGFAHRGGAREAPENTLLAFETALALGYSYLETDAQLTRDGVVVALHDDRIERVSDRAGTIDELEIAAVERADAGYHFSSDAGLTHPFRDRGLKIPRFAELLERWPQARLNIDAKSDRVVEPLLELIERFDAWDRVCFGAVSGRRRERIRELARGRACLSMTPTALALARATSPSGAIFALGSDCIQARMERGPVPFFTARLIRAAHRAGLQVHAWTIDEEPLMHKLLDAGVDGIMTDRPRALRTVFAQRGLELGGDRGAPARA
jgi:glycerophosphoryl diester phosphodiesterase